MLSVCIDPTGVLSRLSIAVDESNYGPSMSTQLTVSMGALSLFKRAITCADTHARSQSFHNIRTVGLDTHLLPSHLLP